MTAAQRFYVNIYIKVDRPPPWCNLSTYHGAPAHFRTPRHFLRRKHENHFHYTALFIIFKEQ